MIEVVYLGRDNVSRIVAGDPDAPIPLTGITRMTLELRGLGVVADSDIDSALIDWSQGEGVIEFRLGDLDIRPGEYQSVLVGYDPSHPDGQVFAHPAGSELIFRVVE